MASTWQGEELKRGEIIKCRNGVDMAMTDHALMSAGYITEYVFKINNEKVYAIEIRGRKDEQKEVPRL